MPKTRSKYEGMLKSTLVEALEMIEKSFEFSTIESIARANSIIRAIPKADRKKRIRNLTRVAIRSNEQMLRLMDQADTEGGDA